MIWWRCRRGLEHVYSTLQFHFHCGTDSLDSEHTVDSKRYPMEMHIVNKRKDLSLDEALKAPDGLAVLGFFIDIAAGSDSYFRYSGSLTTPTCNEAVVWTVFKESVTVDLDMDQESK
ncbi:putative carbonic anhydrase 5 [Odontesthes bonariensis]